MLPIPSTVVTAIPSTAHSGSKQVFVEKCIIIVKVYLIIFKGLSHDIIVSVVKKLAIVRRMYHNQTRKSGEISPLSEKFPLSLLSVVVEGVPFTIEYIAGV